MKEYQVRAIGRVEARQDGSAVLHIDEAYREGLRGLDGFGHLEVLWWCHLADADELRGIVEAGRPYTKLDYDLGIFATRSPMRPNPIALTTIEVAAVDVEAGTVETPYLDAEDGTPLIDFKPYTPSIDRIEHPRVPAWCAAWPASVEASGDFDWGAVFNF